MLVLVLASTPVCTNQIPYDSLSTKWYSATSQLAQLALTVVTYLKSTFLCCFQTELRKFRCAATATTIFRCKEDKKREERADRA